MRWIGTDGVAERIGCRPRQVRERYALLPDFPVPMRPGGNGHPKWRVDEVDAWCEAQRAKVFRIVTVTEELTSKETEDA